MIWLHQQEIKNPPRKLRPDLPIEAETVLLRSLSYNPQDRFSDIKDFSDSLTKALTNDSIDAESEIPKTEPSVPQTVREVDFENKKTADQSRQSDFRNAKTVKLSTPVVASKSKKLLPFAGLTLLFAAVLALIFLFWNWQIPEKPNIVSTAETNSADSNSVSNTDAGHKISYWLEVQKMRNDRPFGESFESSGREIFESGYKFRLNYKNENAGYFYLFNEGKDSDGKNNFNILYPVPIADKDSAFTEQGKPIQTEWNTFGGTPGTEKVWLVWTAEKTDVLKNAKNEAFNEYGKVADGKKENELRKFIEKNSKRELNTEIEKDDLKKRTVLSGSGDIIVHLIELEHR